MHIAFPAQFRQRMHTDAYCVPARFRQHMPAYDVYMYIITLGALPHRRAALGRARRCPVDSPPDLWTTESGVSHHSVSLQYYGAPLPVLLDLVLPRAGWASGITSSEFVSQRELVLAVTCMGRDSLGP